MSIVSFNYYEAIIIFLLLLNAVIYPNFISAGYFIYALTLISMAMTRDNEIIKIKFYLSIAMIILSVIIGVSKYYLLYLNLSLMKVI